MHTALIEGEINGSRVITYKEHKIELTRVNKRLSACGLRTLTAFPEEVRLFDCRSFFTDGGGVYPLYESGNNCGRRIISKFDDKTALEVIETASQYLENMVGLDGKFEYRYSTRRFPGTISCGILRLSGALSAPTGSRRINSR